MAETPRHDPPTVFWPVLVYAVLLAIGIPWYWPADNLTVVLGLPAWVVVAIAASACASVFTAWLLAKPWPAEAEQERD